MRQPLSVRGSVYGLALLLAIAASVWVRIGDHRSQLALATPVAHTSGERAVTRPSILELPVRKFPDPGVLDKSSDIFPVPKVVAAVVAVAPPVPAPPTPSIPAIPELPFSFRGLAVDSSGTWLVQLARGKEYLLVGRGDIIDATYRLDDRTDEQLRFTYLPTAVSQVLSIASGSPLP